MYYFIINPKSRSGAGSKIWKMIRQELEDKHIEFEYQMTEYFGHATEIARYYSSLGTPEAPVTLVSVGGDGTISEILTGITDIDSVFFGVIPTGSGNDFCRGMKFPTDPLEALQVILEHKNTMKMDLPVLKTEQHSGRFGISTGIGYDAAVCHEIAVAPAKKVFNHLKLGKLVYLYTALKQLLFTEPHPMKLVLDGNRTFAFNSVYFIAVQNQQYEGGGFKFCPDAKPNDHVLDVIVVDRISKLKILLCLPTAFFGKHTHFQGIHIMRCQSACIQSAVPKPVHKDGELCGIQKKISVSLEKKPLKIIIPVI